MTANLLGQEFGENDSQVLRSHLDDSEAELKRYIFVVDVDKVLDGLVDDVEGTTDYINSHLASAGNGDRVGIDGLEALLEDRVLTSSG